MLTRDVLASPSEVSAGYNEFSGTLVQNVRSAANKSYSKMNDKFLGQWSITKSNGNITVIGPIILNPDGSFKIAPKINQNTKPASTGGGTKKIPPLNPHHKKITVLSLLLFIFFLVAIQKQRMDFMQILIFIKIVKYKN